jgi:hypothetical protein
VSTLQRVSTVIASFARRLFDWTFYCQSRLDFEMLDCDGAWITVLILLSDEGYFFPSGCGSSADECRGVQRKSIDD